MAARPQRDRPERGVPDALLVGVIAFLFGITLLVWTATGLGGLFAHGAWPDSVTFLGTPAALRHLIQEPHDMAAAWPHTPPEQLSGYGLFWGLLISQLMTLFVLAVFFIGTLTRFRMVRARRRKAADPTARADAAPSTEGRPSTAGSGTPRDGPVPSPRPSGLPPDDPETTERAAGGPAAGVEGPAPATPSIPPATRAEAAPGPAPRPGTPPEGSAAPADPSDLSGASSAFLSALPGHRDHSTPPPTAEQRLSSAGQRAPTPPTDGLWSQARDSLRSDVRYGSERGDSAERAVSEATGPVLVITSAPELWSATKDTRAKLGPSHVFDPSHLLDTPARVRWSPTSGCGDRRVAAVRSAALLTPVRPGRAADSAMADAAETLLRCWLHAAAVDGRPFRHVHRWAQGHAAHEPVRILRTHTEATAGVAGELEATLTAHQERRDAARELVTHALGALSSVHIRDACNPNRSDALAVESFIEEGGTLYVVGESIEDPRTRPGAVPLLTALASHVVEHGRRMAERSSSGRLDPPMTLVLDDVAAVAPLPALPELLSSGAGRGMPTLALMRSPEQARARWPRQAASF